MDFDDMLGYALTVLKRYPPILQQYRQRYRYLCVDEAQDTSRLQYAVIGLLVQQEQNLFLVGDEDQSIYAFAEPARKSAGHFLRCTRRQRC